jgi:hypothetical protein
MQLGADDDILGAPENVVLAGADIIQGESIVPAFDFNAGGGAPLTLADAVGDAQNLVLGSLGDASSGAYYLSTGDPVDGVIDIAYAFDNIVAFAPDDLFIGLADALGF